MFAIAASPEKPWVLPATVVMVPPLGGIDGPATGCAAVGGATSTIVLTAMVLSVPCRHFQPMVRSSPRSCAEGCQPALRFRCTGLRVATRRPRSSNPRFVIAQMLAAAGHPDETLTELEAIRPLLAETFGADSTQLRNLAKHMNRLRAEAT